MNQKNRIWHCYFITTVLLLIINNSCKKDNFLLVNESPVNEVTDTNGNIIVTDKDGNKYNTVVIGTQIWMAENLKTTKYSNGDSIPTTTLDISGESEPKYQWAYNDYSSNVDTYGRLYTWYAVIDSRNICPTGWHVPSDTEWETLRSNLGSDSIVGGKLKESGTHHWLAPNVGATNETGFTALPGGYRTFDGDYVVINESGWFWSTSDNSPLAWGRAMHNNDNILFRWGFIKSAGVSVRCIRNI
jgi:uncharacterized protein (TIGR02145 family)